MGHGRLGDGRPLVVKIDASSRGLAWRHVQEPHTPRRPSMSRSTAPDFTAKERAVIDRYRTPYLVQRWLKTLPYNHERRGETLRTFRTVVQRNTAHCLEAALTPAPARGQHRYPPLLLDLE